MVRQEGAVDDGLLEPGEVGLVGAPGGEDGGEVVGVEAVEVGGAAGGEGGGGGVEGEISRRVAGGEGGGGAEGVSFVVGVVVVVVVVGGGRFGVDGVLVEWGKEAGGALGGAEGGDGCDDEWDADQGPFLEEHVAEVEGDGSGFGGGDGGMAGWGWRRGGAIFAAATAESGDVEEERAEEVWVAERSEGGGGEDVGGAFGD